MSVTRIMANVPSADIDVARTWWTRLLGREPDAVPMPSDLEWHFPAGIVQVIEDPGRAGSGGVTLGTDDIDADLRDAAERGVDVPAAETVPSGQFRIALLHDPDGNSVVLAQDLTGNAQPRTHRRIPPAAPDDVA